MIGKLRTAVVLLVTAIVTLVLAPTIWLGVRTGLYRGSWMLRVWHRVVAWALGLRIHVRGAMAPTRPLMIAANHVSWTDIIVLGAAADVSFVARSEVSGWPLVGWLSRLQRTVFVERERKRKSGEQAGEIARRLASADAMVLFAEGTTGDGNDLLPFKTTLFGAAAMTLAEGAAPQVWMQPVAIAYTRVHGLPMGRRYRPLAAWIGDQDLASHIRGLLAVAAFDVEVHFGEPFVFSKANGRKEASRILETRVRHMLRAALADPAS